MKSAIKNCFLLFGIAFLLFQCNSPEAEGEHGHEEAAHGGHEEEGGHAEGENAEVVELSDVQLAAIDVAYGNLENLNISGFVKANGTLDLPPQNIAAVSAPLDGFVKKANYLVGDYVEKGTVLAVLEHLNYVKLQEEYLSILSQLDYLKSDYERQQQLDSAEISSKKAFQAATAAYKNAQVRKQALEKQLQYLGLSPEHVAQGNISSTIAIRAPFSGYITELNVHNGEFARSEQELYELVDPEHMHLELNVFEQDVPKVEIGQPIRFTVPSTGGEIYEGEVFLVGKSFEPETKTVKVHGHIEGEHQDFIQGLYVEAKIFTGDQQVRALPEEAIVEEDGKSFIFIRSTEAAHEEHHDEHEGEEVQATTGAHEAEEEHGTSFRRVQVVTGEKNQGFVEIKEIPELPAGTEIVTAGAYYLFSEMKKGEGGHHH
ncbi:efflux RND transporter periplasmic adaptor subunit [Nafulsella turpanensis]|uniref:efflux RND transporter periplasmic adaptor subunit n=1 Tax=Nafulsella turpanensis TaxID=1265690 RepID=UPI00034D9F7A|nr:efflux RND transporter periplasmic adaptor subunit [Nafulsella turpanensis]